MSHFDLISCTTDYLLTTTFMGSEAEEASALCRYMALRHPAIYDHMLHIPNGMKSNGRSVNQLKNQGLKPGVPDYFIAIPIGRYHGLWLELKATGGKASALQNQWLERLTIQNYACVIAWGWDSARQCIEQYINGSVDKLVLKEMVEQ